MIKLNLWAHRTATAMATMSALVVSPAWAEPATTQGSAEVTMVKPVQIAKVSDLNFGAVVAPTTGMGRVVINARTGARTSNVNAVPLGSAFNRGRFVVTGDPNRVVNLTTASATISLAGPGASLIVDQLRVNRNTGTQSAIPVNYTIPTSGSMDVGFGGRLNIPTGQTPGNYSGNFTLTVTYQ